MTIDDAKKYLNHLEQRRTRDEPLNKNAYAGARELAGIVSLAEYGNERIAKQALKVLAKL